MVTANRGYHFFYALLLVCKKIYAAKCVVVKCVLAGYKLKSCMKMSTFSSPNSKWRKSFVDNIKK